MSKQLKAENGMAILGGQLVRAAQMPKYAVVFHKQNSQATQPSTFRRKHRPGANAAHGQAAAFAPFYLLRILH